MKWRLILSYIGDSAGIGEELVFEIYPARNRS